MKKPVFLGLILRFSNLNVLHKGLLLQDWVFGLGIYYKLFFKSRGNAFEAFKLMREARQDIFGETTGVLMEKGEKWYDIRQVLLVCHKNL